MLEKLVRLASNLGYDQIQQSLIELQEQITASPEETQLLAHHQHSFLRIPESYRMRSHLKIKKEWKKWKRSIAKRLPR